MSTKNGTEYASTVKDRDSTILQLANGLVQSKGIMRFTLFIIRIFEWKQPAKIIRVLHEFKKQNFIISDSLKTK